MATNSEKAEALARLREWLSPGDTVYTVVEHVSASGMSRAIRFVLIDGSQCGVNCGNVECKHVTLLHPNYSIGVVLGLRHHIRRGQRSDALVVHGCGMNMCRATVDDLSRALGFPLQQSDL